MKSTWCVERAPSTMPHDPEKAQLLLELLLLFAYNGVMALTKRQKQVLDFIADFVEENGYSPSYEELAQGLDLASVATVHKHIQALETRKYVSRGFNQSRSLEVAPSYMQERRRVPALPPPGTGLGAVPLVGRIVAGKPLDAAENRDMLHFADFVGRGEAFGLQVTGDSMIDDHICSGDFVLVEKAADAQNGDIVVALVNGVETTLKRFYNEPPNRVRLQPANSSMPAMYYSPEEVAIQGRLLAVLRKYR